MNLKLDLWKFNHHEAELLLANRQDSSMIVKYFLLLIYQFIFFKIDAFTMLTEVLEKCLPDCCILLNCLLYWDDFRDGVVNPFSIS